MVRNHSLVVMITFGRLRCKNPYHYVVRCRGQKYDKDHQIEGTGDIYRLREEEVISPLESMDEFLLAT